MKQLEFPFVRSMRRRRIEKRLGQISMEKLQEQWNREITRLVEIVDELQGECKTRGLS